MQEIIDLNPKINANLNTNFIKIVAIVTMFLDHLGKIIFPEIVIMQIIGRISFPLFAYCLVVGCLYTSNIKKYALRLAVFGIITQPIYVLAFGHEWYYLNVIIYLLIGLLTVNALKNKNWIVFILLLILTCLIDISYGISGVLLIIVFYLFRKNKCLSIIAASILLSIPFLNGVNFYLGEIGINLQGFALFSLPFIYINTNINCRINKYAFYIFYPLHLMLIYLLEKSEILTFLLIYNG